MNVLLELVVIRVEAREVPRGGQACTSSDERAA